MKAEDYARERLARFVVAAEATIAEWLRCAAEGE